MEPPPEKTVEVFKVSKLQATSQDCQGHKINNCVTTTLLLFKNCIAQKLEEEIFQMKTVLEKLAGLLYELYV